MFGSGRLLMLALHPLDLATLMKTLIISNEEMNDIIKVVKSLEKYGLLRKNVSETIQNEEKEQTGGFLRISLGILGDSLLGNLLTGKRKIRAGEGTIRAGQNF